MTMLALALAVAVIAAVRGMWSPCGLSMLSSLNPLSEGARGNRFWLTAVWYVAGAMLGGAVLGVVCGALASLWSFAPWWVALAAALIAVSSDTKVFGRSLPDHPRQVDERWLVKYRRWIYASGYGMQIGSGFATYIMTAAVYLMAVLAVLTGSFVAAFAVCVLFGAVRGLTILVAAPARTPARLHAVHWRLAGLARTSLSLAIGAEVAVVGVAVSQLAGAVFASVLALAAVVALAAHKSPMHTGRSRRPRRRAPSSGTAG